MPGIFFVLPILTLIYSSCQILESQIKSNILLKLVDRLIIYEK